MGNDQSTVIDEERKMLESLYQISEGRLDTDDRNHVNSKVNAGTAAPNCQPSHTLQEIEEERLRREKEEERRRVEAEIKEAERLAGLLDINDSQHKEYLEAQRLALLDSSQSSSGGSGRASSLSQSQQQQQMQQGSIGSYVQMAKTGYQELVNAIIRPPRAKYREEHLGPPAFSFLGKRFTRTDFTLQTAAGLNLQCSHWEPVERTAVRIPVVIYMHGNASARVEVLPQLTVLLALGVAVFAFDFAGSGKSDGDHVTLGYYEREDLMCVVAHLRATDVVSTIALWGRSMGAVTALLHGDRDPSIAAMVLDSPFADLSRLCEEMVDKAREQGINVPGFVSSVAIRMIRGSVRKQADFDIKDVSPITHVPHCFIPALFVAAENDDFITKEHSLSLHDAYAGDANMIVVDGDHNSTRPRFMFDSVSIFLEACLQIPPEWQLRVHPSMNITSPPWRYPGAQNSRNSSPSNAIRTERCSGMHTVTSPTRQTNLDNDSDIDVEEEAAAAIAAGLDFADEDNNNSGSNIDVETLGMTSERQREIQGSLFRMLGHENESDEQNGESEVADMNSAAKKTPSGEDDM
mmetsp:Transcript_13668/g.29626  ORF Transcript_13668/g.29626 Transcript_13668/m.29626 type:complete len:577 (-) Transcript_13668:46-1776(-)|eukprot:CAMPEP_0172528004 /NCGR_PEP_ID=MMETSP1067-20121228/2522_1 /TAXON_ID=265564 ORGANISM="Thalassiosira punctigera, Strain Tpunct2005C2" /NCGR_SAMPLE_ID=MMETSP1067 /ASSEMBLY_ACC=CAM_ASM_000444 /LENGTH=576 /DNA_ID=CAMNT_0013311849 /DNA_START=182 /DNA_END=1912 /DNA_ORIENTATION=+